LSEGHFLLLLKIAVHSSTGTIASKRVKTEAKRQAKRVKVDDEDADLPDKQPTDLSFQDFCGSKEIKPALSLPVSAVPVEAGVGD
jgi:hypothetical protein